MNTAGSVESQPAFKKSVVFLFCFSQAIVIIRILHLLEKLVFVHKSQVFFSEFDFVVAAEF